MEPQPISSIFEQLTVHGLRRSMLHNLAKAPKLYSWAMKLTGSGSVEKRHYIQLIRRGDVVFDTGANIGNYTVLFSDLVGPRGAVHSFEPIPRTFAKLTAAIHRDCRYRNVFTNPVACSDVRGVVEMTLPGDDYGRAAMRSHGDATWGRSSKREKFTVPTIRLDDYAAEHGVSQLDFIKSDVEGAELLVMKGAAGLLRQFEPLLLLEAGTTWARDFGYTPSDLVNFLRSLGYRYFLIDDEPVPVKDLCGLLENRNPGDAIVNLLCACESRAERLRDLVDRDFLTA